ncbi:MAG: putative ATPase, AAA+ superfamily [Candidatus Methanomarinus sp.]|nr:MAG: putative ATPase, AAA+ superfamily [ANME-2 cluster archaeon]
MLKNIPIKDVELLKTLVYIICKKPGMIVNYKGIARDLGKDQRTIANYFEYLEFGLLIKYVFNYRGSPIASMRKMKKSLSLYTKPCICIQPGYGFDPAIYA